MLRSAAGLLFLATLATPVHASGQLDPRFSADGIALIDASSPINRHDGLFAGLVDGSGRYVGAGSATAGTGDDSTTVASVVRVLGDGQPDTSFGVQGVSRLPAPSGFGTLRWLGIGEQADGKLVVAGFAGVFALSDGDDSRAYVCRLLPAGTLDPEFGEGGCVMPVFAPESENDKIVALALQDDGRILLLANTDIGNNGPTELAIARLDGDGGLDLCFGDVNCLVGGVLFEPEPEVNVYRASALAIAPDGRIVIAGRAQTPNGQGMAVIRLLSNGSVDAGFGNVGHRIVEFNPPGYSDPMALAVRADGAIFVTGTVRVSTNDLVGVAALTPTGAQMAGFANTQGQLTTFFNDVSPQHIPTSLQLQADGKLLVSGHTREPMVSSSSDCGILRVLPNGTLDPDFGIGGKTVIDGRLFQEPVREDDCRDMVLDGASILLFGSTYAGVQDNESMFVRLDQDDVFVDSFESE